VLAIFFILHIKILSTFSVPCCYPISVGIIISIAFVLTLKGPGAELFIGEASLVYIIARAMAALSPFIFRLHQIVRLFD
jgi:hypothetical protein